MDMGDVQVLIHAFEPLVGDIQKGGVNESGMLFEVYLACWQVLGANHDPRAGVILEKAQELLKVRAARISDPPLRHAFLENNPVNRQLAQAVREA